MDVAPCLVELYGRIPPLADDAVSGADLATLTRAPEPGTNPIPTTPATATPKAMSRRYRSAITTGPTESGVTARRTARLGTRTRPISRIHVPRSGWVGLASDNLRGEWSD